MPIDGKHLATHQLLADDSQKRRADSLQPGNTFGPDLESAGAIVDLATALGADDYPGAVQELRAIDPKLLIQLMSTHRMQ
jgi:hypothetical protein